MQLLHGEQYVEVLCPVGEGIPTSANLRTTSTVEAVLDKGKGCLVVISTLSEDVDTGKPLFKNQVRYKASLRYAVLFIHPVAMFCWGCRLKLRGFARAIGSYSRGIPAGGIPRILISKTLQLSE